MTTEAVIPHSPYGGSVIERVIKCPGSAVLAGRYAGSAPSKIMVEGTFIHSLVATALQTNTDVFPPQLGAQVVTTIDGIDIPHEQKFYDIANAAAAAIRELFAKHGIAKITIEEYQKLVSIHPVAGGTPDCFGFALFSTLVVVDLKTGYKDVEPEMNYQLRYYALAALENLDDFTRDSISTVDLYIVQANGKGTQVRHWQTTTDHLLNEYKLEVKQGVDTAEQCRTTGDLVLNAGPHCGNTYCPVVDCPKRQEYLAQVGAAPSAPPPAIPTDLQTLGMQLKLKPAWDAYWKEVEKQVYAGTAQGHETGFMLKAAYGHNAWIDPGQAAKALKKLGLKDGDIFVKTLRTPAQMAKIMKDKNVNGDISDLCERPRNEDKLVEGVNTNTAANVFAGFNPNNDPLAAFM